MWWLNVNRKNKYRISFWLIQSTKKTDSYISWWIPIPATEGTSVTHSLTVSVSLSLTGGMQSVETIVETTAYLVQKMSFSALHFSVPFYLLFIHLLIFPLFRWSFEAVCIAKFSLEEVWENVRNRLRNSIWLSCSHPCGNSKFVTSRDPNFGEVLGYQQGGLSNTLIISSCTALEYSMNYQNLLLYPDF
jgi:hypothetical protein